MHLAHLCKIIKHDSLKPAYYFKFSADFKSECTMRVLDFHENGTIGKLTVWPGIYFSKPNNEDNLIKSFITKSKYKQFIKRYKASNP